ncbi:MAG: beta-N-acetylhexosaminidase [Candidatus Binatia bacterium]
MASWNEKIGQMIMIGLQGEALTRGEMRLLQQSPLGGFILFRDNLKEPKQILSLCRSLWETGGIHPPFIAIDQEGGKVHRLPAPFTHFPSAAALGRTGNTELGRRTGLAAARELSAVGINLNFAPVLDVNSNPSNPIIGERSFSPEPGVVTRLGWSYAEGLRKGGIIPCGKHFPGHGDTAQDSHLELPVVTRDKPSLAANELPPFTHACRNQIESIMTAHVLYPALDPKHPATLSPSIVADLLRREIGYAGVVFSDDLDMKAISRTYSRGEAAILSIRAGVDVLLLCHDTEGAAKVLESLCQEAERDQEIKTRIEESYERIKRLKERCLRSFTGDPEELERSIGIPDHKQLVAEIYGNR